MTDYTDEDLAKAQPVRQALMDLWGKNYSEFDCCDVEVDQMLAAFRAEARRERDKEWSDALVPGNADTTTGEFVSDPQRAALFVQERLALAVAEERERAERIVREVTLPVTNAGVKDPWESGADWMRQAVLRRLRERDK